jgi:hypothetical protein
MPQRFVTATNYLLLLVIFGAGIGRHAASRSFVDRFGFTDSPGDAGLSTKPPSEQWPVVKGQIELSRTLRRIRRQRAPVTCNVTVKVTLDVEGQSEFGWSEFSGQMELVLWETL